MNYVYILEASDGTYYTGWTNNLDSRYRKHCRGLGAKYTRSKKRLKLIYVEEFGDKQAAMQREYAIKQWSRQQKIDLIVPKKDRMPLVHPLTQDVSIAKDLDFAGLNQHRPVIKT